jgi:hypothetical protein
MQDNYIHFSQGLDAHASAKVIVFLACLGIRGINMKWLDFPFSSFCFVVTSLVFVLDWSINS